MRIFKKIVTFLGLNFLIIAFLTFLFAQPSVVKILMKEAQSDQYDTIVIGESHGTTSVNPFVLSDETGRNVFNFSRRLMPVIDLRYILEEANISKQYKTVILDLDSTYWTTGHKGNAGTDTNLLFRLTGTRQLDYIFNVLWNDNYNDAISDYNLNNDTVRRAPKNLKAKLNKDYWLCNEASIISTYKAIGSVGFYEYVGRGFRYGIKKSGIKWPSWNFNSDEVEEENPKAFEELVNYCQDNDIELICIQSALPPYRILNENLDEVHDYFTNLCNQYNVPFYDMNYLREGYLDRTDDDYVDLDGHMMGELGDRHSKILADVLNANDKSVFFYDSYDEVLANMEETK